MRVADHLTEAVVWGVRIGQLVFQEIKDQGVGLASLGGCAVGDRQGATGR